MAKTVYVAKELRDFEELKRAYRKWGTANATAENDDDVEEAYAEFIRVCEKTLT